jgi:hypothetical protein
MAHPRKKADFPGDSQKDLGMPRTNRINEMQQIPLFSSYAVRAAAPGIVPTLFGEICHLVFSYILLPMSTILLFTGDEKTSPNQTNPGVSIYPASSPVGSRQPYSFKGGCYSDIFFSLTFLGVFVYTEYLCR